MRPLLSSLLIAGCLSAALFPIEASAQGFLERSLVAMLDQQEDDKDERAGSKQKERLSPQRGQGKAARAAAAEAERRHGGRALAVVPISDGYRVRLLLEGGRVTTVTIHD